MGRYTVVVHPRMVAADGYLADYRFNRSRQ
jgi:hypothetical protein